MDGQVWLLFYFYFLCAKEFHYRIHDLTAEKVRVSLRNLGLNHISRRESLSQIFVLTLRLVVNYHTTDPWTQINFFNSTQKLGSLRYGAPKAHLLRSNDLVFYIFSISWGLIHWPKYVTILASKGIYWILGLFVLIRVWDPKWESRVL